MLQHRCRFCCIWSGVAAPFSCSSLYTSSVRLTSSNSPSYMQLSVSLGKLQIIIVSEISQIQKSKGCMFSLICGKQNECKHQQYYEKQVTLREGH
jgi:hypothetical protein